MGAFVGGDTYCTFKDASSTSMKTTGYPFYQRAQHYLHDKCGDKVPDKYAEPAGRITILGQQEYLQNPWKCTLRERLTMNTHGNKRNMKRPAGSQPTKFYLTCSAGNVEA